MIPYIKKECKFYYVMIDLQSNTMTTVREIPSHGFMPRSNYYFILYICPSSLRAHVNIGLFWCKILHPTRSNSTYIMTLSTVFALNQHLLWHILLLYYGYRGEAL